MNGFHNVNLPLCLAQYLQGGPSFSTQIAQSASGSEYRKLEREHPIYKYSAIECYFSREEYEEIVGFFNARRGRAYSFRLRDYFDFAANQQIIAVGDDKTTKFQLVKRYSSQTNSFIRKIHLPVESSVKLYIGEVELNAYINYENGEIELEDPLKEGETLFASFLYDVKVRFDIDQLNFRVSDEGYFILDAVNLVEVI
ncbi:MAG: hypothetical protein K0Q51_511 [Rickettsiaceae bacterium]|jgi:uncharacterized protein (TIGR02217 family)|nr:hypothetical protein [Rickettsiaceae bacterium]